MDTKWKQRARVFLDKDIPAHITTYEDSWLNGYIISVEEDHLMFLDRVDGEVPVFYSDIHKFDFFKGDFQTLKKPNKEGENGQGNK